MTSQTKPIEHRFSVFTVITVLIVSALYTASVHSNAQPLVVRHYQVQERYGFGARLLDLALSKTKGEYEIRSADKPFANEGRGEVMVINGRLDIQWHSTNKKRESTMIPIFIPIYRGILGLRLLLAKKDRAEELSNIRTKNDLARYVGGHGSHWGDLPVYAANKLPVKTHVDYELLFKWLIDDRFDYFHRGINEIWSEQARYANDLVIVDSVMLFYPHPIYFFVTKSKPELATRIEQGLRLAIKDGSYKQIFLEEFHAILKKSDLVTRKIIRLYNPVAPDMDYMDTGWWLPNSKLPDVP